MLTHDELFPPGTYHAVPASIQSLRTLSGGAKSVYAAIASRLGKKTVAWPSIRRIALDCGMSKGGVSKAISQLVAAGLVNRHPQYRKSDGYSFNKLPDRPTLETVDDVDGNVDRPTEETADDASGYINRPTLETLASYAGNAGHQQEPQTTVLRRKRHCPTEETLPSYAGNATVLQRKRLRPTLETKLLKRTTEGNDLKRTTQEEQPHSAASRTESELSQQDELFIQNATSDRRIANSMLHTLIEQWQQTVATLNLQETQITTCSKALEIEQTRLNATLDPVQVCTAAKKHGLQFTDLFRPTSTGFVWHDLMVEQSVSTTLAAVTAVPLVLAVSEAPAACDTDTDAPEAASVPPEASGTPGRPARKARPSGEKGAWPADKVLAIYQAYPRRVGRAAALLAITKALTVIHTEEIDTDPTGFLLAQVVTYARSRVGQDAKFTPHPTTWFNQHRFMDEVEKTTSDRTSRILETDSDGWVPISNPVPEL